MALVRSLPLNGPGAWGDTAALQTEAGNQSPGANPNGLPGVLEWVADPLGQRGTVLRATLGPWVSGALGNRAELYTAAEPVAVGTRCNRWYRWSMLIRAAEFDAADRYFSVMQIHDNPDGGDPARWPNLVMYAGAGELQLIVPRTNPPTDTGDSTGRLAAAIPLPLDRWFDVLVGVNLSIEAAQGSWCVIADGRLMLREENHGTAFNDVTGPNFKLGLYNIFKHATPVGLAPIAVAYFTTCEHHEAPFAPGKWAAVSGQ